MRGSEQLQGFLFEALCQEMCANFKLSDFSKKYDGNHVVKFFIACSNYDNNDNNDTVKKRTSCRGESS